MTNFVGVDSVHSSVRSSKLQATTWARPVNFGISTEARARWILRRTKLNRGALASGLQGDTNHLNMSHIFIREHLVT